MRVLAVTNMYPTADHPALGTFVEQQVKGLQNIGIDIDVLLLDRAQEGIRVYRDTRQRVFERLNVGRYDLLHLMYGGIMADLATRSARDLPTVVTFHGSDLLGARLATPLWRLSARFGVLASGRAARRADGVITVSSRLREVLPADVVRSKVRVIPNGIDLDRFKPQDREMCRKKLGWRSDSFHILFANSGEPVKRPELARSAVANLRKRGVSAEIHEMRDVPYKDVPWWINASDVLIVTSLHEGSPTILKECLACNVPVVSVDVGDVREQIESIEGCAVVPSDAAAISKGLQSVWKRNRRTSSRLRMQKLSLEHTAERIGEFYREVVFARKGSLRRLA